MKNYRRSLGKIFLILSLVALSIFLYLTFHKGNADRKISEERRSNPVNEETMADSILVPEAEKIADGNSEANVVPEKKQEADIKDMVVANPPQENKVTEKNTSVAASTPKKVTAKKESSAPMPVSYKKDSLGRLVCTKDNDDPGKSKKNKKHHLDMECCLDPDEDPNPHCYYPIEKYGKYLK